MVYMMHLILHDKNGNELLSIARNSVYNFYSFQDIIMFMMIAAKQNNV